MVMVIIVTFYENLVSMVQTREIYPKKHITFFLVVFLAYKKE